MVFDLREFTNSLNPERTVLFLGAGASIPSGGPSARELGVFLAAEMGSPELRSDDLSELASMLEARHGRDEIVRAVRHRLSDLEPSGGIEALPSKPWRAIYTTNYDQLVEKSYARAASEINAIRSNFDYSRVETNAGLPLFKLHGCVSQDLVDGHQGRIVITEQDYDDYREFRETLFQRLGLDLMANDVLFVGYSLKDPHIRQMTRQIAALQQSHGAPGRLFALIYQQDKDRAALLEERGFRVAFGSLDSLTDAMADPEERPSDSEQAAESTRLPGSLMSRTLEVDSVARQPPNAIRLFNGSPASYADILTGLTFERSLESIVLEELSGDSLSVVLSGVAGVGKTTMARRIMMKVNVDSRFEHNPDFPLNAKAWLAMASTMAAQQKTAVLFIDAAPDFMRQLNILIDGLGRLDSSPLTLLLAAETSRWEPRNRSPVFFARGKQHEISQMSRAEISRLIDLSENVAGIRDLVEPEFQKAGRRKKEERLRLRCGADMYVCLKRMFGSEELDTILLKEFGQLPDEYQDIYRVVAALEAAGGKVHRQLIMRLLGVEAGILSGMLGVLSGLVDEYDIKPTDGIYGWRTRHELIAETIAKYKYAQQDELVDLLRNIVSLANPTYYVEIRTLIDLCISEYGIQRVTSKQDRVSLYAAIAERIPGERVPRHRLVAEHLRDESEGSIEKAAHVLKEALRDVGSDSVLGRYSVQLQLRRAKETPGILDGDRIALALEAWDTAKRHIGDRPLDKYSYMVLGDVAEVLFEFTNDSVWFIEALEMVNSGAERTLDPQLMRFLRGLERDWQILSTPPPR